MRRISTILALLVSSSAFAGAPLAAVPQVGATTTWEFAGKVAFLNRIDRLIDFRLAEIPLARTHTRFIRQTSDGSPTGGGGNGLSPATAWRVRDMLDVRTLLATALQPDTAILFKRGDSFYSRPLNAPQGIAGTSFGNFTLGAYTDPAEPSTQKPRLLGFYRPGAAAWTTTGDGTIQLSTTFDAYWVRGKQPGSDPIRGFRAVPYVKQTSPAAVIGFDQSFAQSGNLLVVDAGPAQQADELDSLEVAVATGAGIFINDVNGVRLDDLVLEGWGMDVVSSVNGCFTFNGSGSNTMLVTGCDWGWGPYHTAAHIVSSGAGGIITMSQCTFGYHTQREQSAGGSGDGFVSFALLGQNEHILDRCNGYGGGLQRIGVAGADQLIQGSTCYSHTNGLTSIGLALRRGCSFSNTHPTRARYASYPSGGDAIVDPVTQQKGVYPTDPALTACYRAFVIDETAALDFAPHGQGWRNVEVNWRFTHLVTQQGLNTTLWGGGPQTGPGALAINRDLKIQLPSTFNGYYFFSISNGTSRHLWLHNRIRIFGGGPQTPATFLLTEANSNTLSQSYVYNSIMSSEVPNTTGTWTYQEWNPEESVGGVANTAFLGFDAQQWDESLNPVALTAPATFDAADSGRGGVPPLLIAAAHPNPRGRYFVEYDITRRLRPVLPTIGPLEARPVNCLADFNADQALDFFDYLDFVGAFSSSLLHADFNHDSTIDFFDYLDFVDAFSGGCQ